MFLMNIDKNPGRSRRQVLPGSPHLLQPAGPAALQDQGAAQVPPAAGHPADARLLPRMMSAGATAADSRQGPRPHALGPRAGKARHLPLELISKETSQRSVPAFY